MTFLIVLSALCLAPTRSMNLRLLASFLHMQSRVAKAHPQAWSPLKKEETFPPIDKPRTAYKKARQNMSLCIWIWFIGQLLQINSLSRPDCFTAMSYSLEWQSPLMQMEGDSHPENPLLDVAGQNDGGHSKCYYTGPTQYQGKAPYCVFIHNLDCRLMVDALLAECWERDNLPCMGISIIISWWDAENTAVGQKAKLYLALIQRPWRSELKVGPRHQRAVRKQQYTSVVPGHMTWPYGFIQFFLWFLCKNIKFYF